MDNAARKRSESMWEKQFTLEAEKIRSNAGPRKITQVKEFEYLVFIFSLPYSDLTGKKSVFPKLGLFSPWQ